MSVRLDHAGLRADFHATAADRGWAGLLIDAAACADGPDAWEAPAALDRLRRGSRSEGPAG